MKTHKTIIETLHARPPVMFAILSVVLVSYAAAPAHADDASPTHVDDLIDHLMILLTDDATGRGANMKRMNEDMKNITKLVVNKNMNMNRLRQELTTNDTRHDLLEALRDNNKFDYLYANGSESLYVKLKERINREDIVRMMRNGGRRSTTSREDDVLNDAVDEFLSKVPTDEHTFNNTNDKQWDPQPALEELRSHHEHDARRIFKGERTSVRHYPFMVSVHLLGRFWCGGVVHSSDLILTSASCLQLLHNNRFFRENPRVLEIRVGSNHSRIGGEVIDALEVYFHPSYNPHTLRHNLAMVRLRRHLMFGRNRRIPKWIPIADYEYPPSPTTTVLILGWGVKKSSQKMSFSPVFLQSKVLPIYPNTFCQQVYGDKFISMTMFCAGTITTGEGACNHDAGGPAIIGGKLVGIISFGPAVCGYPNTPTAFTLLGPYLDWIRSVNLTMAGHYRGTTDTTTTRHPHPTHGRRPSCPPSMVPPLDDSLLQCIPFTTPRHTKTKVTSGPIKDDTFDLIQPV